MKLHLLYFVLAAHTLIGCHTEPEALPTDIWSEGCVELKPYQGSYRLQGMCCTYLILPKIALTADKQFVVNGSYHAFTGAGFSNVPIRVTGQLATMNEELTISYAINANRITHTLKPGSAKVACLCACD